MGTAWTVSYTHLAVKEMARNVAMQIAALKPEYTNSSEVSADYIAHEKEILLAQIMNDPKESQKPEKVIQGMINGRINKELKEILSLIHISREFLSLRDSQSWML